MTSGESRPTSNVYTIINAVSIVLNQVKTSLQEEAIHNEVVGQAHVEDYALKVFLFADNEDRAGRFNK